MKKSCLLLIAFASVLLLVGCGAKPIMQPIKYDKAIDFHIDKDAVVYWEIGKQNASALTQQHEGLIGVIYESYDRQKNPSKYVLSYGKAEQAIFITSFKNILEQRLVFNNVAIITDPKEAKPKDAFITIYFRSTRVSTPELGYVISLSVDMTVKDAGKPEFKKSYFVKTNSELFTTFEEQQGNASKQLAEKLIAGLKQWYEGKQ